MRQPDAESAALPGLAFSRKRSALNLDHLPGQGESVPGARDRFIQAIARLEYPFYRLSIHTRSVIGPFQPEPMAVPAAPEGYCAPWRGVLDEVVRQIGQCQPRQTEITTVYHRHCYHLYAQIVAAGKQAGAFGGGFQQIAQVTGPTHYLTLPIQWGRTGSRLIHQCR